MRNIKNQGRVDFEYRTSEQGPVIIKTSLSNDVSTHIIEETLKVVKSVDKADTCVFDKLSYTIEITNENDQIIKNVFFQDSLSEYTSFVSNTLFIDSIQKRCARPEKGFYIGDMAPGQKMVISFMAIVQPRSTGMVLRNTSEVVFDYVYNIYLPPVRIIIHSNEASACVRNILFKQFSIEHKLVSDCNLPAIGKIEAIDSRISVLDVRLGDFLQGGNGALNRKGLVAVLQGKADYNVSYTPMSCGCSRGDAGSRICSFEEAYGFSAFMMVPYGAEYYSLKDLIAINSEDLMFTWLNPRSIRVTVPCIMELL